MSDLFIKSRTHKMGEFSLTIPDTTLELDGKELGDFYPVNFLIDNVPYDLEGNPPLVPAMLAKRKKEVLNNMDLGEVINNLNLCADLLYLAFNGVAGEVGLQKDISNLQSDLEKLCSDTTLTMVLFKNECDLCMTNMVTVYQAIFNCQEGMAITMLKEIGASAKKMADRSDELATSFEKMADKAQEIHGDTIERRNVNNKEAQAKAAARRETVANLKAAAERLESLTEDIKEAEEELGEAKADAKEAQIMDMVMGMTSVIANGVGAIASTVVAGMTMKQTLMMNAVAAVTTTKSNIEDKKTVEEKPVKEAKEKADKAEEELEEKKGEIKVSEAVKKELEKKAEEEEDKKKKEALKEKIEAAEAALVQKKAEQEQAKAKRDKAVAGYKAAEEQFNKSMAALTEQLNKQQEFAATAAAAAKKEVAELRQQRNKLREEKRGILGNIRQFSESIKNAKSDEDILRITVESLNQAIMALSKVVVTLKTATHFWKGLAQYCEGLANPKFINKLEMYQKMDLKVKLRQYYNPVFLLPAIDYACRWKALQEICALYSEKANEARVKVLSNIEISSIKNASIDGARRLAPSLAKTLLGYINDEKDRYSDAEAKQNKEDEELVKEMEEIIKNRGTQTS